ncbi:MAG: DUF5320 domain-containing protein [Sedimentisphaerales bacterium]|nr:DUF5320 domain-containing protein [Sedimentisphaerales bacterium]
MPGFDGTGPQGRGPLTGRGRGFCVLQESKGSPGHVKGFVGIQGIPVSNMNTNQTAEQEVITMPFGDGTGPGGFGPMTGRAAGFCAGYPVPGYINPAVGRLGFYGPVGYGSPYACWVSPWLRRRFGFGLGFGRGRGRGRGRVGF